jgi:hypothetical protein
MKHRWAVLFSAANALLASSHLLVPTHNSYAVLRALQALARSLQGPLEFASFAILTTAGVKHVVLAIALITALGFAAAKLAQAMWRSADELREILPSLAVLYFAVGILSTSAGDVVVNPPVACQNLPAPTVAQRVVTYLERGWQPGAYYFLLETDPGVGRWRQVTSRRLDIPMPDPCRNIQEIFPAEGIDSDAA